MSGTIKIAAALIGLVWLGRYLYQSVQAFRYKVVGYGIPDFRSMKLTVPVIIEFINPTGLSISADSVIINFYLIQNGEAIHAGTVNQPVNIPAGTTKQTVNATADIGNVYSFIATQWQNILGNKSIRLRTDVNVVYHGIKLPKQSYENVITV